ncbi:putative virus X resistance protein-like, coiled-coil [Helianthus annuus]|uniref:Virus X resistance protein-like, coiled-coil n=1 Tax=Helianthus annuus TaxID=4232 RepID=A0A9K3ELW8_HELAN|nr:putative virus X resistance protein-like, coiled-coil [Helianthus annuus]
MAETITTELVKILFQKLSDEAFKRIARAQGIHNELKELKTTLSRIQDLLNDASQKEVTHKSVKSWLNALQHLAYDIDDVLDDLATEDMHRKLTLESRAIICSKDPQPMNERFWQCNLQENGVNLGHIMTGSANNNQTVNGFDYSYSFMI